MPINLETCVEPHLDPFTASLAVADYKAPTLKNYRSIIRKLGQAERLGRSRPHI